MNIRRSLLVSVFASLGLAACGGGGAGPVDQATAEDGCQRSCDHDVACGDPEDPGCVTDCVDDVVGVFRDDVFTDIVDCITALECTASSESCLAECSPTSTHETYEARCREELAACGADPGSLDEACEVTPGDGSGTGGGDVGFICVIATPIIDDLIACFDEPDCNAIAVCQQAVYERLNF